MKLDESAIAPTQAATVMLLREEPTLEVFMLERHLDSDFVGGAYVFPGGKVDPNDYHIPRTSLYGSTSKSLVAAVGPELATALAVAAIRETFEESGVLLGSIADRPIDASVLNSSSFMQAKARLAERGGDWEWNDWLEAETVRLDLSALHWWSWWVTPAGVHRRFDTKFFVAHLPNDQAPVHDNIETTDSVWLPPAQALEAAASGAVSIILPTRKNLSTLEQYAKADSALAAAQDDDFPRPRIEPTVSRTEDGQLHVMHPSFDKPEPV